MSSAEHGGFASILPGTVATETPQDVEVISLQDEELGEKTTDMKTAPPAELREKPTVVLTAPPPTSEQCEMVRKWLLSTDAAEAKRLLAQVQRERPSLFFELGTRGDSSPTPFTERKQQRQQTMRESEKRDRCLLEATAAKQEPPIVQFSCFMYFCCENEKVMSADVMRIGDVSGPSEVHFRTRDATAKAGEKYEATAGKILFNAGDIEQTIKVPIIDNPRWDTTTEFIIELTTEPAPMNCTLGRYLWMARVKIVDDDTFPSNKYRSLILSKEVHKIPKWGLLFDYFRLNWGDRVVRRGTIKMMCADILHNMYFFSNLLMNVYLVDKVLKGGLEDPLVNLLLVITSLVVPFAVLHILDFFRNTWKVGGASRSMLQKALMRKFLNYAEGSRAELKRSDLVMAMTRDVTNLVDDGYGKLVGLFRLGGQIFFVLLFQLTAPPIFDKPFNYFPFVVFSVFPLLQMAFLFARQAVTFRYVSNRNDTQDGLVAQIDRIVTNYRMIADYNRRPFFVDRYSNVVSEFNSAAVNAALVLRNNAYFPQWVSIICVAGYTVLGGMQTINHPEELTLGMFLANVKIISTIGSTLGSTYATLLDMQNTFPALVNVVTLLNLATDVPQRMMLNRARREETAKLRLSLRNDSKEEMVGVPLDNLPILVENLTYEYGGHKEMSQVISCSGTLKIRQGNMVTLIGPRGEGKSTLLRLLGAVILPPKPDGFFVPSHLRVLHISSEPLFFLGTLYENVAFGVTPGDEDASLARVRKIVQRLGLPDNVLSLIDTDTGTDKPRVLWGEVLSYTQQCLLCLARALVANPELMCVHKPTMPFDETQSATVMKMFREFCTDKGVEQDASTRHRRRPRTCVITSSKMVGVELADTVYKVDKKDGVRRVERDNVTITTLS